MRTLEELRNIFDNDTFACAVTGITIDRIDGQEVVCSVNLDKRHMNGNGHIMGGVIFTLADFCFAVCANVDERGGATVTASTNISFLNPPKGRRLIASANIINGGAKVGFYETRVRDEMGTEVALATTVGANTGKDFSEHV